MAGLVNIMPIDPTIGAAKKAAIAASQQNADPILTTMPVPPSAGNPKGIVDSNNQVAAPVTPTSANQTQWNVDPNQTVQNQISGIIAQDSPLQQLARTSALQQSAKSGRVNSSMAVGAAQDAVIRSALPIAQQDAQTFAAAGQTNATEANKLGMYNAGESNTTSRFNAELATKNDQFNISEQNKIAAQNLDIASREKLAQQEIEFKKFASASDAGSQFFDTYQKSLNAILINPDLSTEPDPVTGISPKQAALDMAAKTFQAGITMHQNIAGLDLSSILTFDQAPNTSDNDSLVSGTDTSRSAIQNAVGQASTPSAALSARQKIWDDKVKEINAMQASTDGGSLTRSRAKAALPGKKAAALNALGPRPS